MENYSDTINELIEESNYNETALSLLKNLSEQYPFCNLINLLYLVNFFKITNDEKQLLEKLNTVFISSKESLFSYIKEKLPQSNVNEKNQIINDFLLKQINIGKPRVIEINDEDLSLRSVSEDNEIVSETLAEIYFQQGKYEKAEEMYKKLSLLFPEKMIYFAEKIEKINQLKNK